VHASYHLYGCCAVRLWRCPDEEPPLLRGTEVRQASHSTESHLARKFGSQRWQFCRSMYFPSRIPFYAPARDDVHLWSTLHHGIFLARSRKLKCCRNQKSCSWSWVMLHMQSFDDLMSFDWLLLVFVVAGGSNWRLLWRWRQCEVWVSHGVHRNHACMGSDWVQDAIAIRKPTCVRAGCDPMGHRLLH
jgi:hypothetical protein